MKWIAIAGGWRKTNSEIENKIREEVKKIISEGNGIVSGGALGVDYLATDEALKMSADKNNLKIFIPSAFDVYKKHYQARAGENVITKEQADTLLSQLEKVKEAGALVEGEETALNKETYFNRITKIIASADELVAFHINQTEGTQDTIDKAKKKGIPVKIFTYTLE